MREQLGNVWPEINICDFEQNSSFLIKKKKESVFSSQNANLVLTVILLVVLTP